MPCPTKTTTTPDKSSAKFKKKKSAFDVFNKTALITLLKLSWKDGEEVANANSEEEEDYQESKASSEVSITNNDDPYYTYDQELFGQDIVTTLDLVEN